MTIATAKRIPTITATSTENFYDVLSSDGFTHYPMLIAGPGQVRCGCPAGEAGRNCYHRSFAVANLIYLDPEISLRLANLEYEIKAWRATLNKIEDAAELETFETMMNEAA